MAGNLSILVEGRASVNNAELEHFVWILTQGAVDMYGDAKHPYTGQFPMKEKINIYCDESCHLENDKQVAMVLGAVWCPRKEVHKVADKMRQIKSEHGFKPTFELKWTKVSPGELNYYQDVLDYFFQNGNLHFRALVIPDKSKLRHELFQQDHNTFYYKMNFQMIKPLILPENNYHIYLDIKDSRGAAKVAELKRVLKNEFNDYLAPAIEDKQIIGRVQLVRSHEVELLQMTDMLIGIISYANRKLSGSRAKVALLDRMRNLSKTSLTESTLLGAQKVNIFVWEAR